MVAKERRFLACRRTSSPLTAGCALVTRPAGRHQTTVAPLGSQEPTFRYSAAERAPAIPNVARWLAQALRTTVGPLGLRESTFQYSAAEHAPAIPNVARWLEEALRTTVGPLVPRPSRMSQPSGTTEPVKTAERSKAEML